MEGEGRLGLLLLEGLLFSEVDTFGIYYQPQFFDVTFVAGEGLLSEV